MGCSPTVETMPYVLTAIAIYAMNIRFTTRPCDAVDAIDLHRLLGARCKSADVNDRAMVRIGDRPSQNLMGHWCSVAFTKKDVPQNVEDGIPLFPFEIGMRRVSRMLLQVNEQTCNRI